MDWAPYSSIPNLSSPNTWEQRRNASFEWDTNMGSFTEMSSWLSHGNGMLRCLASKHVVFHTNRGTCDLYNKEISIQTMPDNVSLNKLGQIHGM